MWSFCNDFHEEENAPVNCKMIIGNIFLGWIHCKLNRYYKLAHNLCFSIVKILLPYSTCRDVVNLTLTVRLFYSLIRR